jgi:pyruvate dehydrogenase E2 component (dihydrolipoamide acetyltransferase)
VVPVGEVLVVLDLGGEAEEAVPASPAGDPARLEAEPRQPAPEAEPKDVVASAVGDIREDLPGMATARERESEDQRGADRALAAPATRRLARELGIDIKSVTPTGPAGRITREDVERHARTRRPSAPSAPSAPPVAPPPPREGDERVPVRGLRKRIFENMARSKHTAAHFTYVDECDVSALRVLRDRMRPLAAAHGEKLTFLPFIIKAVVAALKRHPTLNCLIDDAAQEMVLKKHYDIGVAAATDAGLIVPVVRRADRRSILEIAREIARLSELARAGKLGKEDLGGSTFTITSLGKLGGVFATPVINYPEVAILGVHEMKRRPVVRGDDIVIGEVMMISLSFDHRVIDGHVGAAFAQEIIGYLEEPDRLMLDMA